MLCFGNSRIYEEDLCSKNNLSHPLPTSVASVAVDGSVVVSFIVHCCYHCLGEFCVWSLFCYAVISVLSRFAIISAGCFTFIAVMLSINLFSSKAYQRQYFMCHVIVCVLWIFLKVSRVGMQFVIVAFPGHTHLLLEFLLYSASDQGLHCLLTECSIKMLYKMKIAIQKPLKWTWAGPIDKSWKYKRMKCTYIKHMLHNFCTFSVETTAIIEL